MDVDLAEDSDANINFVDTYSRTVYFGAGGEQDIFSESLEATINRENSGEEAPPGTDFLEDDDFLDPFATNGMCLCI